LRGRKKITIGRKPIATYTTKMKYTLELKTKTETMKHTFTPAMLPDERTKQILYSQAWNLAVARCSRNDEALESHQKYFFDQLMKPYEPLLKAREEREAILNKKSGKAETKEKGEDDINYENDL